MQCRQGRWRRFLIPKLEANLAKRIRVGLWRCGDCKKQFTVKIGAVTFIGKKKGMPKRRTFHYKMKV